MTATMENIVRDPSGRALTGPIVRGDVATIDRHLQALARLAPQFLPLYTVTGIEIARTARRAGTMGQAQYAELIARFRTFIKTIPPHK
jgi:predicted short-subunit dehydrogenase-like oxidoreductase (DUF2520 family)